MFFDNVFYYLIASRKPPSQIDGRLRPPRRLRRLRTRSEVISFVPPGENLPWSAPGGKIEFYKIKYMENQHFLVGILWGVPQRVTPKERPIETIGLGLSPLGKICPHPLWTEKIIFLNKHV